MITSTAEGQVANIPEGSGLIYKAHNVIVVRKNFGPEHPMKKHNHPGVTVMVTLVKGAGTFTFNESEHHDLSSGQCVLFDGKNFIQATFSQETELVISLIPLAHEAH